MLDDTTDPNAPLDQPPDGGPPEGTGSGAYPPIWNTIAQYFQDATQGLYKPTQQDISQWGSNIDTSYLSSIRDHIYNVWAPQWKRDNPAPGAQGASGAPPASGGGAGGGPLGTPYAPYGTPYTPPPMLDLGGQPGLTYIPPAPQFAFNQPSVAETLTADPSYQFRFGEGLRALDQGAAMHGTLNTGGQRKAESDYGQQTASQEYGNVYGRTYQYARDKFNPLMTEWGTLASAGQHENDLTQQRAFDQYLQHYNEWRDWTNSDFDRKYKIATA